MPFHRLFTAALFIISQNPEIVQESINRKMNKQTMVCSYKGILLNNICATTQMNLKTIMVSEKIYINQGSPKKQNRTRSICIHTHKRIIRTGLYICWGGQGQTGKLAAQAAVLRQNFFFFNKPQFLLLRPPTDWTRPTHIIKGNLLY